MEARTFTGRMTTGSSFVERQERIKTSNVSRLPLLLTIEMIPSHFSCWGDLRRRSSQLPVGVKITALKERPKCIVRGCRYYFRPLSIAKMILGWPPNDERKGSRLHSLQDHLMITSSPRCFYCNIVRVPATLHHTSYWLIADMPLSDNSPKDHVQSMDPPYYYYY